MRIAIGCDHRGVKVKQTVIRLLEESGHSCHDFGCYTEEAVDYPDIAKLVAQGVARKEFERGILLCDSGIGMSMAANKVNGIRAALCHEAFYAGRARMHNDANVLCLAAGNGEAHLPELLAAFLNTPFEGGRHQRRLDKLAAMERETS